MIKVNSGAENPHLKHCITICLESNYIIPVGMFLKIITTLNQTLVHRENSCLQDELLVYPLASTIGFLQKHGYILRYGVHI